MCVDKEMWFCESLEILNLVSCRYIGIVYERGAATVKTFASQVNKTVSAKPYIFGTKNI